MRWADQVDPTERLFENLANLSQTDTARPRERSRKGEGKGVVQHGDADSGNEMQDIPLEADADAPWTIMVAAIVARWTVRLSKSLLGDRLLKYYVEWCDTERVRRPGVAFTDTCIAFDDDSQGAHHIHKRPKNNIYLFVQHPFFKESKFRSCVAGSGAQNPHILFADLLPERGCVYVSDDSTRYSSARLQRGSMLLGNRTKRCRAKSVHCPLGHAPRSLTRLPRHQHLLQ